MNIKYFNDTDTALVEFTKNPVKETREISENVYIDIDEKGNLVSMTIEHTKTTANLPDLFYQQIEENWKYRFENTLNESQEIFKKWLLKKGYDFSKLSEEDIERIIEGE
jgi:uncharacterized protein YuzE